MALEYGSRWASLGGALGQGIEKTIESQLQLLQQKKLSDLMIAQEIKQQQAEREQLAKNYESILDPKVSRFLSALTPKEREVALQNIGGLMQLSEAQAPQQTGIEALMRPAAQVPQQQAAPIYKSPSQMDLLSMLQGQQGLGASQPQVAKSMQPALAPQQYAQQPQIAPQANVPMTREQMLQDIFTPEATKRARQELALKQQKATREEKAMALSETKKFRDEITDKAKAAKSTLHSLQEMEDLNESGKLDTPGYVEFLKNSGLDIPALMNPESQEFQKVAYDFMSGMRATFGGKVSNLEMENFLKAIPSLSQSPEGRNRVISLLKYKAQADLAYNDAMDEIVEANNGIPPTDLPSKVLKKIDKKLDALHGKFKKQLAKPIPAGQNKLVTAIESATGTVLNRIPRAIMGAGAGAYAGSKLFPGLGTVGGAVLGGLAGLGGYSVKDLI